MRKTFTIENLDCAHCAANMEHDISALPGVKKCTITFMTSRISLSVEDGVDFDSVLEQARSVVKSHDKDCDIVV